MIDDAVNALVAENNGYRLNKLAEDYGKGYVDTYYTFVQLYHYVKDKQPDWKQEKITDAVLVRMRNIYEARK